LAIPLSVSNDDREQLTRDDSDSPAQCTEKDVGRLPRIVFARPGRWRRESRSTLGNYLYVKEFPFSGLNLFLHSRPGHSSLELL
jgi:hypothetical protein